VNELLDRFEAFLESRYSSLNTKRAYIRDVSEFLSQGFPFTLDGLNMYMKLLFDKGIKPSSISRKLASLSIFFDFLKEQGVVEKNYVKFVDKPKVKRSLPKFLDMDETVALLESVKDKRDRAILELLYSSSLRADELVGLDVEDVDFEHNRLRVKRKGGRTVYVPFSERAKRFLKEYLRERSNGALFLNRYGRRLSTRSLQKIVKKHSMASIFKDISPHTLRHTRATHLLNSGMDIRMLQRFLGHSTIKATQIYTHVNLKQLSEIYDKTHPLSKDE